MRNLFLIILTFLMFSCKDNGSGLLEVSTSNITLSPAKPYAEISITKGAGNYRTYSSNESVAICFTIDNKLYISGNEIGKATITLVDQDNNQTKVNVIINEYIARAIPLLEPVYVKIGDTKNIAKMDANSFLYMDDTNSIIRTNVTTSNFQVTGIKEGTVLSYQYTDFWPKNVYNLTVVSHYAFSISPSFRTLSLSVGGESEYYILSGCGNYSLTMSDASVISAELRDYPSERVDYSLSNPKIVHINAFQKGTAELTIANVETSESVTINVIVG